jgi:RNA polymerase sigma-70 factor (ECF subfamily)
MDTAICLDCCVGFESKRLFVQLLVTALESLSKSHHTNDATIQVDELEDVHQSQQGNSEAYRRLIERNQGYVGRILWRFTRDRRVHEELVQDVFVEAYMSLGSYRVKAPFAHWLARIATRVGYRYIKQQARRKTMENLTLQQWDQLPDKLEQTEPDHAADLVHKLLSFLPPRDRLVLTLRYLEQCNVAETARRIGWTKAMVKVQTMRALKKLQKLYEKSQRGQTE